MFRGKLSASLVTVALVASVLPLLGAARAAAAVERGVSQKRGELNAGSVPGFPRAGVHPGRQMHGATVVVRYDHERRRAQIEATVRLRANAPDNTSVIDVGVGILVNGNDCRIHDYVTQGFRPTTGTVVHVVDPGTFDIRWNCALVLTRQSTQPDEIHDAVAGSLTNTYIQPKLAISYPRLIGKGTKQLKLVRGVAQNHEFAVKNTGKYRARNVVLTARGSGLKSVRKKVGTIAPGETKTVRVPVRLASKKKRTTVRFTVAGSGVKASRAVRVRAVKAPARPAAGTWRSTNTTFTFRIKKGAITNFRGINLRMKCGGYGSYPTYRNVTLSFPRVKVPRHGYVEATKKYRKGSAWYSASLSGRVVGKKLTQGKFTYATAGNCMVIERFAARR